MRTDLIAVWLVKQWLMEHAPDIGTAWEMDVEDNVKGFAARVKDLYEHMDAVFASQSAIASTAIDLWSLENVVIFGGGRPTPLTATPDQVLYYTDANPEVVAEAAALGYDTMVVDVNNIDHLSSMEGATTGIATGLFHFLNDDQVQDLLLNLAETGIHTVAFNNVDPLAGEELMDQWTKAGNQMYARTLDDMPKVLPDGWQTVEAYPFTKFIINNRQLGEELAAQPGIYNVYLIQFDHVDSGTS
jgi:hypothetical protein